MGINLQKGQKIDLTKGNPQISKIMVGLGWDMSEARGSHSIDCDASVIMLNNNNKMTEMVYFANKKSKNNAVIHSGDNLTGAGAGDDETIVIEIPKITPETEKMIFHQIRTNEAIPAEANYVDTVEIEDTDFIYHIYVEFLG